MPDSADHLEHRAGFEVAGVAHLERSGRVGPDDRDRRVGALVVAEPVAAQQGRGELMPAAGTEFEEDGVDGISVGRQRGKRFGSGITGWLLMARLRRPRSFRSSSACVERSRGSETATTRRPSTRGRPVRRMTGARSMRRAGMVWRLGGAPVPEGVPSASSRSSRSKT